MSTNTSLNWELKTSNVNKRSEKAYMTLDLRMTKRLESLMVKLGMMMILAIFSGATNTSHFWRQSCLQTEIRSS